MIKTSGLRKAIRNIIYGDQNNKIGIENDETKINNVKNKSKTIVYVKAPQQK